MQYGRRKRIISVIAHGRANHRRVSFGFFLGEGSPAIWRGPMVSKAVKQFARGVAWPELDVLVVDLPPGTGDVPLSLVQAVAPSGAVIVTQPPRVAAIEARKSAEMFRTLEVPVLGVANDLGVSFLGEVPFDAAVVSEGDDGVPTMVMRPESATGSAFDRIAAGVANALGWRHVEKC
jgi:ATP-binding protein involved in chromosome partitioning